jgi:hypothetical protein
MANEALIAMGPNIPIILLRDILWLKSEDVFVKRRSQLLCFTSFSSKSDSPTEEQFQERSSLVTDHDCDEVV